MILRNCLVALLGGIAMATQAANLENLKFGSTFLDTESVVKAELGEPLNCDSVMINYEDVLLYGMKWNKVDFNFTNGKLAEVRCYLYNSNKNGASKQLIRIAKQMEALFPMTRDYEEDGCLFYTGGTSPEGIGHLFTLFISPQNGTWSTQLRFGPFRI